MRLIEAMFAVLAALAIGFMGGCVSEKLGAKDERAVLAAQLNLANGNIDACATTLQAIQSQGAEELARAEEQVEHTARAVESLARENLHMGEALQDAETRLAASRDEPTCREQLETELCPAIPLL